jgi:hypothetical protein
LAGERRRTLLELVVGGLASIPGIASVIAGATSPGRFARTPPQAPGASTSDLEAIAHAAA